MDTQTLVVMSIIIGTVLVSLVAIVGGFIHYRRERLLMNAERMKALEMGRDLPDDQHTAQLKAIFSGTNSDESGNGCDSNPARKAYSTALWVAFWGFLAASGSGNHVNQAVAIAIAASVGAIGVTAMICGTVLATRGQSPRNVVARKPVADRDAYDFAGHHG